MSQEPDIDCVQLARALSSGERGALARALNLLDDRREAQQHRAMRLLTQLHAASNDNGPSRLIGLTGPPGAGKSSLVASLISVWRQRKLRVGVLAVDPSSPISGGALLGDRLRMKTSSEDDGVFVRSLSSRGEFGGLCTEVWPMSQVMLAAFDVVVVETVGVGQREVDIASMSDTTCFVAQPGSGDSVQFLKAGVLEMPHIVVVNKADMGDVAMRTLTGLETALQHEHPDGDWQVCVLSTSALNGTGVEKLADTMEQHHQVLLSGGTLGSRRFLQRANWVVKRLEQEFGSHGINRLGGADQLLQTLQQQDLNPVEEYNTLRLRLSGGA